MLYISAPTGAMIHKISDSEASYAYLDTDELEWDPQGYWRPMGTVGDR